MSEYLETAKEAARAAGAMQRENFEADLDVNEFTRHDIKLELDVRCQELITDKILAAFPDHAIYGEEGMAGNQESEFQWIVDPIDGTVNFFYGIPHFCVSIAMRRGDELRVGVIYDPMMDELYEVERGGRPMRNGKEIGVSKRGKMGDAVVTVGFSKTEEGMKRGMAKFERYATRVRKTRMMGSAALGMAYVACGRLDGYVEEQISLWDIAAGQLLVEAAGGKVARSPGAEKSDTWSIVVTNGKISFD
ncbi:MAG: inositol monophosphatase family protein [Verrucomicrobiota bacterium]